jgi:hypothetical protein
MPRTGARKQPFLARQRATSPPNGKEIPQKSPSPLSTPKTSASVPDTSGYARVADTRKCSEVYNDLAGDCFLKRDSENTTKRPIAQLEVLGHHVTLEAMAV